MKNLAFSIICCLLFAVFTFHQAAISQDNSLNSEQIDMGKINFHAEFYGLARFSALLEFNISQYSYFQIGCGIGGFETIDDRRGNHHEANPAITPSIAFQQLFGRGKNKLELGIGIHHGLLGFDQLKYPDFFENPFAINGFIGWRRKFEKGEILRMGFAPMYQPAYDKHEDRSPVLWPLAYLSFGKSIK